MTTIIGYLSLATILIYAVFAYGRFSSDVKTGVGMVKTTTAFQQPIPGASMRILVTGDSSAVGVGSPESKNSTAGRIAADFPDAEVVNRGVSGARLSDLREWFEKEDSALGHFDILLIQIGGNDITHFTSLADAERDLRAILSIAGKHSSIVLVLHTGDLGRSPIFPWPINHIISFQTRRLRDIYLRVVPQFGAHYVDLYGAKVDDIFHTDTSRYYGADSFHLSGDGYGVWYDEIKKVLDTVYPGKKN